MLAETQILTTQELADYIKLNEKTILKMAQQGELPGVKVGNQWRFHLEAVDRYLQKGIMQTPEEELDSVISTTDKLTPLSRLLEESLIELDLKAENKREVLSGIVDIAYKANIVKTPEDLFRRLVEREEMLSTAVGNGIAVPHPRDFEPTLFQRPNIVMAKSRDGVDFSSPDGKKVHLFFMTCAPNMMIHLKLLAKISKLLHVEGVIDRFMQASTSNEIIRLLLEMERKHLFPWEVA